MFADVRISKTRRDLRNALLKLLESESFEKITVSKICKIAEINRVTFYSHYKDKYELCSDMFSNIVNTVVSKSLKDIDNLFGYERAVAFCMNLIEATIDECYLCKQAIISLSGENNSIVSFMLMNTIQKALNSQIEEITRLKPMRFNIDLITSFFCGGLSKVIIDWLLVQYKTISKSDFIKTMQDAVKTLMTTNNLFN